MSHAAASPVRRLMTGLGVLAAGGLLLAGCAGGPGDAGADATPAPSSTAAPSATRTPDPTPTSTPPIASSEDPSAAPTGDQVAGERCLASSLALSAEALPDESGMSQYGLDLVFENTSPVDCVLEGYPGVSFVGDGDGTQLGEAADRSDTDYAGSGTAVPITTVTLAASGGTATAHVHGAQAGAYDCAIVEADGLRVYPPHSTESLYVAYPQQACSDTDAVLLTVAPVVAG